LRAFWLVRKWLLKLFGKAIADKVIWWAIYKFGGNVITKSFCSIFPLSPILEAPDFDKAIKSAAEDYLAKQPEMTTNILGFEKWMNETSL